MSEVSGRGEEVEWMNWVEIGRGSGKDENRVKVGWVEGGRYFVGGFKCARNYVRAKRVGASSFSLSAVI